MRRVTKRRGALLLTVLVLGGAMPAGALPAHPGEPLGAFGPTRAVESLPPGIDVVPEDAAAMPAPTDAAAATEISACLAQVSCGSDCVAELAVGFCSPVIKWEPRLVVGGVQIGPSLRVECRICECWYTMEGLAGSVFKRTVDLGCGASVTGLTVY